MFHTGWKVTCEMFTLSLHPKTFSKKLYFQLYLTQIVHSNGNMLFHQSYYGMLLTFNYFYFEKKFCASARVSEMFVLKTLLKKLYLWFYLTQIVHSNGKIPFT